MVVLYSTEIPDGIWVEIDGYLVVGVKRNEGLLQEDEQRYMEFYD